MYMSKSAHLLTFTFCFYFWCCNLVYEQSYPFLLLHSKLCHHYPRHHHPHCKSMHMFNNLVNLSIESNKQKGWQVMPLLFKSCPILQTLVFKGLVHKVTNRCGDACACNPQNPNQQKRKKIKRNKRVCCLQTCRVKVLEISDYGGCFQELEQMRHFLANLECLETVKIGVHTDKNSEFLRANVMALPRLSSKCTIQFT